MSIQGGLGIFHAPGIQDILKPIPGSSDEKKQMDNAAAGEAARASQRGGQESTILTAPPKRGSALDETTLTGPLGSSSTGTYERKTLLGANA